MGGSAVRVARTLGLLDPGDVVVAIDLRRYEEWVLDAVADAHRVGARTIAITDSVISPVATGAVATFVVAAASPGPFDSHVGTLAPLQRLGGRHRRQPASLGHRQARPGGAGLASHRCPARPRGPGVATPLRGSR